MSGLRDNWRGWKRSPSFWCATWFGCGLIRPAPGTWGTLGAVPLAWGLLSVIDDRLSYLLMIAGLYLIGVVATEWAQKASNTSDAGEIVIDEVVGFLIACLPLVGPLFTPVDLVFAFGLFRFFDIVKPFPIGDIDRTIKGAHGVMLDDVAAGFFAAIWLFVVKLVLPL